MHNTMSHPRRIESSDMATSMHPTWCFDNSSCHFSLSQKSTFISPEYSPTEWREWRLMYAACCPTSATVFTIKKVCLFLKQYTEQNAKLVNPKGSN
jgi:hypothetical protein